MRRLPMISLALALALASPCLARTWHITPDGTGDAPTIQAGIDSALAGDTVLLADGTYTGEGNRDISYSGKAIAVCSETNDPAFCVVDCDGSALASHRGFVFECGEGQDAVLRGVTITNGAWYDGDGGGGGILCWGASPTLANLIIIGNRTARRGGGIECGDSACPTLENAQIVDNTVEKGPGGGIYWNEGCTPVLADVVFDNNSATSAGGALCGEFYFERTLSNCRFVGNSAGYGGAVALCCSDCTFEDCQFLGNYANYELVNPGGGGALILLAGATVITRCTFEDNSSVRDGGAITIFDSRVTMQSCVFDANLCVGKGGCVFCTGSESDLGIHNCTFARNLTTEAEVAVSGVRCEWYARLTIDNSIIAYSPVGVPVSCEYDCHVELTCCDIFGNSSGDWVGCIAGQYGLNGNFSACPSFCCATTGDFRLCDQSPCLPGNHPDGYDCCLIGALGEGCICEPSKSVPSTWGAIKSLFR